MTGCSWDEALVDGRPECSSARWAAIGGLLGAMLLAVCCGAAPFWLIYRRRRKSASEAGSRAWPSQAEREDLEESVGGLPSPTSSAFSLHLEDSMEDVMKEVWDPEPPNEADAVPMLLYVSSPKIHASCTGEYELVPGERPNGQPLWAKKGGDRWLYSGVDGRWYVGGIRSKDMNFACASGFIYCHQLHRSAPPDELTSGWEWGQGKGWFKDPGITVTAMESPISAKAAKAAAFVKQDSGLWCKEAEVAMPPAVLKDTGGLWPKPLKDLQEDGLGTYVVTHEHAAVTAGVHLSSPVDFLSAGAYVNVLEVVRCPEQNRIRGRIEKPDGWISLENLEDGYRWAVRQSISDAATETTTSSPSMQLAASDASTDTEPGSFRLPERMSPPVASAPCPTSGHSPGLRARTVDPPESRPLPPKDPPLALRVRSPNGQASCAGVYELVQGERPNGQALWKQQDVNHWIYCGKNGRWAIAGLDVKEDGFSRTAGFISQTEVSRDQLPDEYTSPWQRWDGSQFVTDPEIEVATAQPKSGGGEGGASSSAGPEPKRVQPRKSFMQPRKSFSIWKKTEVPSSPPTASSSSTSGSIEVSLECVQAVGIDVAGMSRFQRCISKSVTQVTPWRIGPRLQPQIFSGLSMKAWSQDCFFELTWKPPCLYLTRPALGPLLLIRGEPVRQPWSHLPHGAEIGLCGSEGEAPHLTLQVLLEGRPRLSRKPQRPGGPDRREGNALQADGGPCVMDLRGCGLSAEGRSAVQASRAETLRVIV